MSSSVVETLEAEVKTEIEQFKGETDVVVDSPESYEYAGEIILKGKAIIKDIDAKFEPSVKAAYAAHKAIKDLQNSLKNPVSAMISELQLKANAYVTEQERKRREEQARLDAERRKAEETERARLAAEAKAAENKGDAEKAAALREESETIVIIPEVVESEAPKTIRTDAGTISAQSDIEVAITDKATLLRAIADQGRFDLVEIKEAALKRFIKAAGLADFPGCHIEQVKKAAFRVK